VAALTNVNAESAVNEEVSVIQGNSLLAAKYLSIAEISCPASALNLVSLARLACSIGLIAAITIKAIAPKSPMTIKSSTSVKAFIFFKVLSRSVFIILIHLPSMLNMNH